MTDTNDAAVSGSEPAPIAAPVLEHKAGGDGPLTARDAARSIIDWRRKGAGQEQAESAEPATPAPESTEVDAAPLQEAHGETEVEADPAEQPPIEPPKSWTKEARERFASLPRETQEYLAQRETERDRELRRSQNEAAEHRKGIETERQRLTQLASQYETALPNVVSMLQAAQAQTFPDIKNFEDVQKLQAEDPLKFQEWQVHQMRLGAAQQEMAAAQQRQMTEGKQQLEAFQARETARLLEKFPELSDKDAFAKITSSAGKALEDLGFKQEELRSLWNGEAGISLHDHRFQSLLIDGIRYREAQQQKESAVKTVQEKIKSVPPVQRPGTAQGKGAAAEQQIKSLESTLSNAHGINAVRAAAALTKARRAMAKR